MLLVFLLLLVMVVSQPKLASPLVCVAYWVDDSKSYPSEGHRHCTTPFAIKIGKEYREMLQQITWEPIIVFPVSHLLQMTWVILLALHAVILAQEA